MLKKGFVFCGLFLLTTLFSKMVTEAAAQVTAVSVDCNSMSYPVLGFETSKGQDPDDISAFLADMTAQGYSSGTVDINNPIPSCVDLLIVHGLANNAALASPYSNAEATEIRNWVEAGHSLMLSGDWGSFNDGTQALFNELGYTAEGGVVSDATDYDPAGPTSVPFTWVIYQADNFAAHPILDTISSIQFQFSGWLNSNVQSIMTTDADANPPNTAVMAAFEQGSGCVTLTMDSNWYSTDNNNDGGYSKEDNAQAARQMVAWLLNCTATLTAVSGGPYFVDEGSSINLDGTQSFDPDGQPLTYSWDLDNDGQFDDATGAAPSFSAASLDDGVFPISLRIASNSGNAMHSSTVTVQNVAPNVTLLADSLSVPVGTAVNFSGSFTDPGTLDTHDLLWNFGDGTTPTTDPPNAAHIYTQAGTYQTILTVTDDDGGAGQAALSVSVWMPGGHTLFLPMILNKYCADRSAASDVVLAIDSSRSMLEQIESGGVTKLTAAQEAAVSFLELLNFSNDQAGVVSFDRTAVLQHPLSNNQSSLVTAVNSLSTDFETRMDLALIESHAELIGSRHLFGNAQVIILLTDGLPRGVGETAVIAAAANAKADGITIYTIGLGQNVNATLLQTVATTPDLYYFAPSTADLEDVYAQIATGLPCTGG